MNLEKGRITSFQFMLSIACYIQASSLLSAFFAPITKQDSWMIVLFGMTAAAPVLLLYIIIIRSFPDKNLIEICKAVFGRAIGALVSLMFIFFFLTLTSLNLLDLSVFMRQTILVETPTVATVTLAMVVCAYAVYKGLKVVTRYAPAFVLLSYIVMVTAVVLTLNIMNFDNFLPILNQPVSSYVQGTHIIMTIPFGELVVFLMVAPAVKRQKKSVGVYIFGGFLLGSITLLTVVARDNAVLGNVAPLFTLPPFETLRMVSIAGALNRMEILFAIVLIILLFFKISFLFYVTVLATAQLFDLNSYHPLVLIMGALVIAYSTFIYPSTVTHADAGREVEPVLFLLFEMLLPLAILIVGRIRGLHKSQPLREASLP
jgi:spore germination protein KB